MNDLRADPPVSLSRRQTFSQLSSIFDSLGLVTPFTVGAKILMRKIWETNRAGDWDESFPRSVLAEWITFHGEFFDMRDVSSPRCIKPKDALGNPQFAVFSDASKEVFGACAYAVSEIEDRSHVSNLISAESRLVPKQTNIYSPIRTLRALLGSQDQMFPLQFSTIKIRQCKVYSRLRQCTSDDPKGFLRVQHFHMTTFW